MAASDDDEQDPVEQLRRMTALLPLQRAAELGRLATRYQERVRRRSLSLLDSGEAEGYAYRYHLYAHNEIGYRHYSGRSKVGDWREVDHKKACQLIVNSRVRVPRDSIINDPVRGIETIIIEELRRQRDAAELAPERGAGSTGTSAARPPAGAGHDMNRLAERLLEDVGNLLYVGPPTDPEQGYMSVLGRLNIRELATAIFEACGSPMIGKLPPVRKAAEPGPPLPPGWVPDGGGDEDDD